MSGSGYCCSLTPVWICSVMPLDFCEVGGNRLVFGNKFLEIKKNEIEYGTWLGIQELPRAFKIRNRGIIAFRCGFGKFRHGPQFAACDDRYWTRWPECRHEPAAYGNESIISSPIPSGYHMWVEDGIKGKTLAFKRKFSLDGTVLKQFPPIDVCLLDTITYGSEFLEIKKNNIAGEAWFPIQNLLNLLKIRNRDIIAFRCGSGKFLHGAPFSACIGRYWTSWPECRDEPAASEVEPMLLNTPIPGGYQMSFNGEDIAVEFRQYPPSVRPALRTFPAVRACYTQDGNGRLYVESFRTGHVPMYHAERQPKLIALHGEWVVITIETDGVIIPEPKRAFCNDGVISDQANSMKPCYPTEGRGYMYVRSYRTGGEPVAFYQHGGAKSIFALHGETVDATITTNSNRNPTFRNEEAYCSNGFLVDAVKPMRHCYTIKGTGYLYARSFRTGDENVAMYQLETPKLIAWPGEQVLIMLKTANFTIYGPPDAFCHDGAITFSDNLELPCTSMKGHGFQHVRSASTGYIFSPLHQDNSPKILAFHREPVLTVCDPSRSTEYGERKGVCVRGTIVDQPQCMEHCLDVKHRPNVLATLSWMVIWKVADLKERVFLRDGTVRIRHGAKYRMECKGSLMYIGDPEVICNKGKWTKAFGYCKK